MNTIKKFFISSLTDDDGKINKDLVSLVFRPIISTLYLIMIVITFSQVIFRYLLTRSSMGGRTSYFFFIWIIFLGASIALIKGVHIGVDIFKFFNENLKKYNLIFINLIIIVFCFIIMDLSLIIDNFSLKISSIRN